MQPWKLLSSTPVLDTPWLRVTADRCELPNGLVLDPYYVIHEPDWVQVLAVNDAREVLVIRQYRHAAGAVCTELPGGVVDPGEAPLAAAQRELREETGYAADAWAAAGALYANPARQTNRVHLFVAQGLSRRGPPALEASEDIEHAFLSLPALEAAINDGAFSQGLHVASVYRGLRFLGLLGGLGG